MKRFADTLFPECLADWIDKNNPVQVIDGFVGELDLAALRFEGVAPTGIGEAPNSARGGVRKVTVQDCVAARIGGDEFGVVLPPITTLVRRGVARPF